MSIKKKLDKSDIDTKVASKLSVQDYSSQERIEGVKFVELRNFPGDDGSFVELGHFKKGMHEAVPGFEVKQINYSLMLPGAIKAWHVHYGQEDVWFVPSEDRLLVGLVDLRKKSKTNGVKMRFVMGGGKSNLLYIPRGVAHGASNMGNRESRIIYLINNVFDVKDLDENRLPWDTFGADFWRFKYE